MCYEEHMIGFGLNNWFWLSEGIMLSWLFNEEMFVLAR